MMYQHRRMKRYSWMRCERCRHAERLVINRVYTTEDHEKKPKRVKKGKKATRGNRHPTLYNLFFSHRMKEEREKDKCISYGVVITSYFLCAPVLQAGEGME